MRSLRPVILLTLLAALAIPGAVHSESQTQAQTPPAPACSDAVKSHQFDFWVGEWDVTEGGEAAGTNSVRAIVDGCVVQENWRGARGSAGTSLNYYDPRDAHWHQHWVWRNGTTLELAGDYADHRMVLEGDSPMRDGGTVHQRVTWFDNPDGTVRQLWEQSKDGGATWEVAFDGLYRRQTD
jgi:hypothetical protein